MFGLVIKAVDEQDINADHHVKVVGPWCSRRQSCWRSLFQITACTFELALHILNNLSAARSCLQEPDEFGPSRVPQIHACERRMARFSCAEISFSKGAAVTLRASSKARAVPAIEDQDSLGIHHVWLPLAHLSFLCPVPCISVTNSCPSQIPMSRPNLMSRYPKWIHTEYCQEALFMIPFGSRSTFMSRKLRWLPEQSLVVIVPLKRLWWLALWL